MSEELIVLEEVRMRRHLTSHISHRRLEHKIIIIIERVPPNAFLAPNIPPNIVSCASKSIQIETRIRSDEKEKVRANKLTSSFNLKKIKIE